MNRIDAVDNGQTDRRTDARTHARTGVTLKALHHSSNGGGIKKMLSLCNQKESICFTSRSKSNAQMNTKNILGQILGLQLCCLFLFSYNKPITLQQLVLQSSTSRFPCTSIFIPQHESVFNYQLHDSLLLLLELCNTHTLGYGYQVYIHVFVELFNHSPVKAEHVVHAGRG